MSAISQSLYIPIFTRLGEIVWFIFRPSQRDNGYRRSVPDSSPAHRRTDHWVYYSRSILSQYCVCVEQEPVTVFQNGTVYQSSVHSQSNASNNWPQQSSNELTILLPTTYWHYNTSQRFVSLFVANWSKPVVADSKEAMIQLWVPAGSNRYVLFESYQLSSSKPFQYVPIQYSFQPNRDFLIAFTFPDIPMSDFIYSVGDGVDVVAVKVPNAYDATENDTIISFRDVLLPRDYLSDVVQLIIFTGGRYNQTRTLIKKWRTHSAFYS